MPRETRMAAPVSFIRLLCGATPRLPRMLLRTARLHVLADARAHTRTLFRSHYRPRNTNPNRCSPQKPVRLLQLEPRPIARYAAIRLHSMPLEEEPLRQSDGRRLTCPRSLCTAHELRIAMVCSRNQVATPSGQAAKKPYCRRRAAKPHTATATQGRIQQAKLPRAATR